MAEQQKKSQQAQEPDLNQLRKVRREKLAFLEERGIDPFGQRFDITHFSSEIKEQYAGNILQLRSDKYATGFYEKNGFVPDEPNSLDYTFNPLSL